MTNAEDPWGRYAMTYWLKGWRGVLHLPLGQKSPPPRWFTGPGAPYLSKADLAGLLADHEGGRPFAQCRALRRRRGEEQRYMACLGKHSIGLRLPDDVIALDVDAYKGAGTTLGQLEARLGALPATWINSARWAKGDHISGHRFYRVPGGRTWKGEAGRGIDVLQSGHRYAVVWPSTNPDYEDEEYRWISPALELADAIPDAGSLPALPDTWIEYLSARARVAAREMGEREATAWEQALRPATRACPTCVEVKGTLRRAMARLAEAGRSRHDTAMKAVHALMTFGGEGHAGAAEALEEFRGAFIEAATQGGKRGAARSTDQAEDEWDRLYDGAIRKAAARHPMPAGMCACPNFEAELAEPGERGEVAEAGSSSKGVMSEPASAPRGDTRQVDNSGTRGHETAPQMSTVLDVTPGGLPPLVSEPKSLEFYEKTQDGMAQAFRDYYGDRVRFVPDGPHSWFVWDGERWVLDILGEHRELLKRLFRRLPKTATAKSAKAPPEASTATLPDATAKEGTEGAPETEGGAEGDSEAYAIRFRRQMLSNAGVTAVASMAQTIPSLVVPTIKWNHNPWALNTPSGVFNLRTGERHDHSADEMHTRVTAVRPNFKADRSEWIKFLRWAFLDDEELIDYVWRLVGYSATGLTIEHILPFCYGTGGNGKGVFLEVISHLLGLDDSSGYASPAANDFLMQRKNPEHLTQIASLSGRRMVICDEVKPGDKFDEAKTKLLTSAKTLKARYMRENEFTFRCTHTIWLIGNDYPELTTGGDSFRRRVRLIPFLNQALGDDVDPALPDRLIARHGPAILAWVIEGAREYARRGLRDEPAKVRAATDEYASSQDHLKRFIEERCAVATGSEGARAAIKTDLDHLYPAYESWCRAEGIYEPTKLHKTHFGRQVIGRWKVVPKRGTNGRGTIYYGIGLVDRASSSNGETQCYEDVSDSDIVRQSELFD